MQITVEQAGEVKQGQYGPYGSVKAGNEWYIVNGDPAQLKGKTLDVEVTTKTGRNGPYKVAKIIKEIEADPLGSADANANQSTALTWSEYQSLVKQAHELALKLEPDAVGKTGDDMPPVYLDRAPARHAIVATILISYGKGNFDYPEIPF
jgi:hypothetical protein